MCNSVARATLIAAVVCAALVACKSSVAGEALKVTGAKSDDFDFDGHIRPLLAKRCVQCHGPGEAEAGLRLDDAGRALAELESGNRAIVPGKPAESELLRRVTAGDAERMPPEGKRLDPGEVELLRRWIAQGAPWPEHWAYRPLSAPRIDFSLESAWPRNSIDHFVLRKLHERGMRPSPEADRRTLLRRVYIDLAGMLPTPAEVDSFVGDESPDAYARVVDRLLASPQYGERWARHWMDVVHYADSHGFEHDLPREIWPYRDYLVRSFNEDKPYAHFVREQVAGDVLFPGDMDALAATGFLATGPWDLSALQAGNADSTDHEISQYLDRDDIVSVAISTFVSTTVHCARCHDHKFDPVTQADYYSLQAVFAGIDKAHRLYDPDPAVAQRRDELVAQRQALPRLVEERDSSLLQQELHAEIAAWEASQEGLISAWKTPALVECRSANGATLVPQADGSVLSTGDRPDKDTYTLLVDVPLEKVTAVRLEVLTDKSLAHEGPGRQENGNLHLNELVVSAAPRSDPSQATPVKLRNPRADFNQDGWSIERAIDGNPATAWGIYPKIGQPHEATFEFAEPYTHADGVRLTIELQQIHGGGHLIGRPRLSFTDIAPTRLADVVPLPTEITQILETPVEKRDDLQRAKLAAFYLQRQIDHELASLPPPAKLYCGTNKFDAEGGHRPAAQPRQIFVLHRGDITKPGKEAHAGTLSCVPGLPSRFDVDEAADEGARRAALANWLADSKNVLTWRSIANRLWHYHFGRGLADTPNDFGRMGAAPTHPELLDWLAVALRDNGGSLKAMHRLIVTSATYRQSSAHHPQWAALDGDNRYLWRMNRQRLDAEAMRDSILRITGTLNTEMGGPPVKQFVETKKFNLRAEADYNAYDLDAPDAHRRGLYRFHFRTIPDPLMHALDCPDGTQLAPNRTESITALQALAVMNDRFVVRQSEHLAGRLQSTAADEGERINLAYRLLFGRAPSDLERDLVLAYAREHGLANACRMLLNTNEFMFID